MMFVTGPAFSGKRAYVRQLMGWSTEELARHAMWDVQNIVANTPAQKTAGVLSDPELAALAEDLATYDVVIACELGGGVVPLDASQRAQRENAGRLACLLAQRADCVVRICCGIPQVLKGTTP